MIIRNFLDFIMKGRIQALLVAILAMFVPFFGWVTSVTIGLVTLRVGLIEGMNLVLWTGLPNVVLAWRGEPTALYINVLAGTLLTWILAAVLRLSRSWRKVLLTAMIIGVAAVGLFHLFIPDVQAWWLGKLELGLKQASESGLLAIPIPTALEAVKPVTVYISGILTAGLLLMAISNVLIARWGQALLYNPGGLKKELYQLHLTRISAFSIIILAAILFSNGPLGWDSLPVLILPLALMGMIVIHVLLAKSTHAVLLLGGFYGLLILLLQHVAVVLALVALLDSVIDFRNRLKRVE